MKRIVFLIISISLFTIQSCSEKEKEEVAQLKTAPVENLPSENKVTEVSSPTIIRSGLPAGYEKFTTDTTQLSQYIRRIFQDSKGDLWFGTVGEGVVRYDGKTLTYYTTKEGFSGNNVQGIAEDKEGNVWFGTTGGVSRWDGKSFTNFTENDGIKNNFVFSLCISKSGTIWVGTNEGVYYYNPYNALKKDEKTFTNLSIPATVEVESIIEDKNENIWIATHGNGVFRYDGKNLKNFSEKDGLTNNIVNCILQDKMGDIWFSTSKGGLSKYNGASFTNFTTEQGLTRNEAFRMYEDKAGNIWVNVRGSVCRYNGISFTDFREKDGLTNTGVQSMYEDRAGNFWFGTGAGLFIFNGKTFYNVSKKGPWPQNI